MIIKMDLMAIGNKSDTAFFAFIVGYGVGYNIFR